MLKKITLTSIFIYFSLLFVHATVKDVGIPVIRNIERVTYEAGTQNWGVDQAANGIVYFGNNEGLLSFDGQFWNTFAVPNGSNIRSVLYSDTYRKVFVGAFNDFGFFSSDSIGKTKFTSLKPLLSDEFQNIGDVWNIYETPWGLVFQAFEALFVYDGISIDIFEPRSLFHKSYFVNGTYYVFDRDNGLMEFRSGFLKKIPGGDFFAGTEIWSVLPLNSDEVLIGTASDGLYRYDGFNLTPWNTPANKLLKEYQIYSSLELDDNHFAFGTIQNGLLICDKNGNVKQIINREKGLQNNTVLSMYLDRDQNLWLGLDNGIDYVELNSPITLFQDYFDFGTGYTSISYQGYLYFGTNQGLFCCEESNLNDPNLSRSDFKMVSNTSGQVWSLQIINDKLFCGHNNGSFQIEKDKGILLNSIPGCWAYHKLPGYSNLYIEGTYTSMELCKFENGTMKHLHSVEGIYYSSQEVVCLPDRYIWVSHAFNGLSLYRLTEELDSVVLVKKYTTDDGLPGDQFNRVNKMQNGDIVLTTRDLLYKYNKKNDRFEKADKYNNMLENSHVHFIQEDKQRNIWYVKDENEGGVLRYLEDGSYKNVTYPFSKLQGRFIGSFFNFNAVDENNVLIALEKGFAHYSPNVVVDYKKEGNTLLTSVSLLNTDNVLYEGIWGAGPVEKDIEYKQNSLRFTFSSQFFEGDETTMFSYILEGFDDDWSRWQSEPSKEYTNVPDGRYTFRVKSMNYYGSVSEAVPYSFHVLPPWYKSLGAIIAYFISILILVWIIIYFVMRRFERTRNKEQAELKKKYQEKENKLKREALEAEKEIIRLRNDKLRANMIHKDKELANSAMNLVQKNRYMNNVKEELKKLQSDVKVDSVRSKLNLIIRKLDKETTNDKAWEVFETNFDEVHEDFLNRLREKHPDVTPKELKLAAFLRMNISSKEIATLLNITTRGVEISRYRLRKKLDLDRSKNLTDYILSI